MGNNYYDRRNLYSDDVLVECYVRNQSQIKAARELGVSRETVARAVRRVGIPLIGRRNNGGGNSGTPSKISDDDLIECVKQGMSCSQIALKYSMSAERVFKRGKRLGLDVFDKGRGGHWRQRAQLYRCDEYDETITLDKVFEKYDGVCQICGLVTDKSDIVNGHIRRMYPTVDHIIPLSKGGTHTWGNVQLAHMMCNAGKCDKLNTR